MVFVRWARPKCEKERPVVIPTANIASLEFNPKPHTQGGNGRVNNDPVGLFAIAKAIKDLRLKVEPPSVIVKPPSVTVESPSITVKPFVTVKPPSVTIVLPSHQTEPEVQSHCAFGWDKVATIGPFPEDEHELEQDFDGRKKLEDLFAEMKQKFVESKTLQLLLIGRSHAKPPCKKVLALYGSNNGLAQARAKWVLDELKGRFPERQGDLERTILLSAGPLYVRGEATPKNRAKDRSVEVWTCWTPEKSEPASSSAGSAE